jgi:hypothetical protein
MNFRADVIDIKIDPLVHTVTKRYHTTVSETGNRKWFRFRFPVSELVELHIVRIELKSRLILLFIKFALKFTV